MSDYLPRLSFPRCKKYAAQYKNHSAECIQGDLLVEKQRGGNHGKQRIQIQVIGCLYGTELLEDDVPYHKTDQRGEYAEESQVHPYGWPGKGFQRKAEGVYQEGRKNRENSVEEDLPGDERGTVASGEFPDEQTVEGP